MASSLKCGSYFSSLSSSESKNSTSQRFHLSSIEFFGKRITVPDQKMYTKCSIKHENRISVQAQTACVIRAMNWWENSLIPNMVKIHSAEQLVNSLTNAGDKLVIIDFYSPGCGGCKSLHPKICQPAEQHPNATFLKVNYEELYNMCKCLNVHVLPFFRFYRGSEGRLCSFSCTNATIRKFKAALAKHAAEKCSLGQAKGLNESELRKLVSVGELPSNFSLPSTNEEIVEDLLIRNTYLSGILSKPEIDNS